MAKRIKGFLTLLIITALITTSPFSAFADNYHKRPKVKYYHLDRAHKAGEIRGSFQRCTGDSSGLFVYIVGRSFSALLTPAGDYTLSYVPPGRYSLAFVKDNHILTTIDDIKVRKRRLTDLGPIEHCVDADNDHFDESVDCNDNNPNINPGATEVCDGVDNDCNGQVDDVPGGCIECTDADNDGSFAQDECDGPVDCDDNDPTVHPNAPEVCDGRDNNCDGTTDENCPCPSGTEDCDDNGFCETDVNNDSNNCGVCGTACGSGQTCESGVCGGPTQCQVSEWGPFSECSKTCGGGVRTRTRTITVNGENCPPLQQSEACNTQPCPVDCVMSEWSPFSACSVTCGGGTQTRTRSIVQQPQNGGAACGPTTESRACNTQACQGPVDCVMSEWSPFSACSVTCGGGAQTRTRTVVVPPANGGRACGSATEARACNEQPCAPGFECDPAFGECSTP